MPDFVSSFIGKKFHRVTVTENVGVFGKKRKVIGVCDCGRIREYELNSLKTGGTKSCGCLRVESSAKFHFSVHGLTNHPLYQVWGSMKDRCYCVGDKFYNKYGGRGVTICEEWKNDFKAFYDWAISNGWEKGLQLDKDKLSPNRIGLVYSPETCCFLSRKENMRYRSTSILLEYNGEVKNLSEWCELLGLSYRTTRSRIKDGWSVKDAFEKQIITSKSPKKYKIA